jgi:hypothetical protein
VSGIFPSRTCGEKEAEQDCGGLPAQSGSDGILSRFQPPKPLTGEAISVEGRARPNNDASHGDGPAVCIGGHHLN